MEWGQLLYGSNPHYGRMRILLLMQDEFLHSDFIDRCLFTKASMNVIRMQTLDTTTSYSMLLWTCIMDANA